MSGEIPMQRQRWGFTFNNYPSSLNIRSHLSIDNFFIKRAVWGFEIGASGTPHLQGYLELKRSLRLSHVKKIFPSAYWFAANGNSFQNFRYCTKSGNFDLIGDFTKEQLGAEQKMPLTISLTLKGLLSPVTCSQTKLSKEYADRHHYFDKMVVMIQTLEIENRMFKVWKSKKLFAWQFEILRQLMVQDNRQILWVVDDHGNSGKTFLANYLNILYNFQLLDGTVSARDLCFLIKKKVNGFCFDVARSSIGNFNYSSLESIKNGYLVSGKYAGKIKRFDILPVVVLSNFHPNYAALSMDRWNVQVFGQGSLSNISKVAIVSPAAEFPFHPPDPLPNLSEDFECRKFIENKLGIHTPIEPETHITIHTSQVAGPSDAPLRSSPRTSDAAGSQTGSSLRGNTDFQQEQTFRPGGCPHRNTGIYIYIN